MPDHRIYIIDRQSQLRYRRALRHWLKPGATVLDLGTGTGVHALFACHAGAGRVYAVENNDIIHVAQEVASKNGCEDRITFLQGHSSEIDLPEKVDLIVTHQGLPELLTDLVSARDRFLKPGGRLVPSAIRLHVAPAECPRVYEERVQFWKRSHYGFNFSAASESFSRDIQYLCLDPEGLLARPVRLPAIDLNKDLPRRFIWDAQTTLRRSGVLHGLGAWFEYDLAPGVILSTKPPVHSSGRPWKNALFPVSRPVRVEKGDRLEIELCLCSLTLKNLWKWRLKLKRRNRRGWTVIYEYSQSNLNGLLPPADILSKLAPQSSPGLSRSGQVVRQVLNLCAQGRTLEEIEGSLMRESAGHFLRPHEVSALVAEVIRKYA